MILPWEIKGIVLTAPLTDQIDDVVNFIDNYLAKKGINLIVLQIRYRYQFKHYPECRGYDPLSKADVDKLLAVCKKNNIKLIPKMNLLGHQSGIPNSPSDGILHGHHEIIPDMKDALLRSYPEFDEQQHEDAVFYGRTICPTNPLVKPVLFDMVDELLQAFEADAIHIGCDEAFNLGLCPRCARNFTKAELFGNWITAFANHCKKKGAKVLFWGDRMLSAKETGYNMCEASVFNTEDSIDIIPQDNVIVCDWHYEDQKGVYPSVDIFAKKKFDILISPWRDLDNAVKFIEYAKAHDVGHVKGLLLTTWCNSGELARHVLYGEPAKWTHTAQIAKTIDTILSE